MKNKKIQNANKYLLPLEPSPIYLKQFANGGYSKMKKNYLNGKKKISTSVIERDCIFLLKKPKQSQMIKLFAVLIRIIRNLNQMQRFK